MVPERNPKPSLRQALHRLAGATYTEKLSSGGGRIDRLLASGVSDREIVEEFYLAALSRFPSKEELTALEAALGTERKKGSRREAIEDFVWALLNSQEFSNH
jgi:DNA-binding GntR family transcriptional regulator